MPTAERQHRSRTILAFALVYFFWGSTYLGISIAVEKIGAPLMAATRFSIAGVLMLAWCALNGRRIAITARDALRLAVIGVLLLSIANVVLAWAEETVPTGLAALLVSVTPLWFLVIETWILRGDRLSRRGMVGLALGSPASSCCSGPSCTPLRHCARRNCLPAWRCWAGPCRGQSVRCSRNGGARPRMPSWAAAGRCCSPGW